MPLPCPATIRPPHRKSGRFHPDCAKRTEYFPYTISKYLSARFPPATSRNHRAQKTAHPALKYPAQTQIFWPMPRAAAARPINCADTASANPANEKFRCICPAPPADFLPLRPLKYFPPRSYAETAHNFGTNIRHCAVAAANLSFSHCRTKLYRSAQCAPHPASLCLQYI